MKTSKHVLQVRRETDLDGKHEYHLSKNSICIARGKATHDNIMKLFYEKYPCIIKYVKEIEHL